MSLASMLAGTAAADGAGVPVGTAMSLVGEEQ
jgi:hypothetical protein